MLFPGGRVARSGRGRMVGRGAGGRAPMFPEEPCGFAEHGKLTLRDQTPQP